jgi:prevent-host-death family protein
VSLKKVPFTNAREELSALIDEVQNSGRPIAITRHGKPVAVLMNMEALEQKLATQEQRPWMLRGSGTWKANPAEVENAIQSIRQEAQTASDKRMKKLARGLPEKK